MFKNIILDYNTRLFLFLLSYLSQPLILVLLKYLLLC